MGGDIFGSGTACTVHLQPAYTLTVSVVTCSTQLPQVSRAAACVPVLKVLQVLHLSFICPYISLLFVNFSFEKKICGTQV